MDFNLVGVDVKVDKQTAKFNSPSNFPAVRYFYAGSSKQFSPVFEGRLGMGLTQTEKAIVRRKVSTILGS